MPEVYESNCWRCRTTIEYEVGHFKHFCPTCEALEKAECEERAARQEAARLAEVERLNEQRRQAAIAAEKRKQDEKRADEIAKQRWLAQSLPAPFLKFNGLPAGVDRDGYLAALAWYQRTLEEKEPKPNLYLFGPSGIGKTWTCNSVVRLGAHDAKVAQLQAGAIIQTDGVEFQREVHERTKPRGRRDPEDTAGDTLDDYLKPMRDAWLLIFDELDKLKGTPRVSLEFFGLLNERIEAEVPTVLASFAEPVQVAHLLDGATEKRLGLQVARRLRDFFTIIELKKGQR